jgi:hypothetical protein
LPSSDAAAAADLPQPGVDTASAARLRTAHRVFQASLVYTALLTVVWLFFLVSGREGGRLFGGSAITRESLLRVTAGFFFFSVVWGWIWYLIRAALLRRAAGFSKEEVRSVFGSRMRQPFDLQGLLARHSERTIRVIDMVGRRGRFITLGLGGFTYMYSRVLESPTRDFMRMGIQENLFDGVVMSWLYLAAYRSEGFFGRVVFGAQSRIMDGVLARANCLLITMLWTLFKFVMVPLGGPLSESFPPRAYGAVFAFIWLSYIAGDASSEVVGSLLGRQRIRVWGLGDVNRKSLAGTWACFAGSLAVCLWAIQLSELPTVWLGLALAVSVSNTLLELFSPRGTDDFTMATANALLCLGFGALVY